MDNSGPGVIGTPVSSGGTFAEYPNLSRSLASKTYDSDMVLLFAAVRNAFGKKGAPGSKLQVPNEGQYRWDALFPYVDYVFHEFDIGPDSNNDAFISSINKSAAENSANVPDILTTNQIGVTISDVPIKKMSTLATYYMRSSPDDYFCRQSSNAGNPLIYGGLARLTVRIMSYPYLHQLWTIFQLFIGLRLYYGIEGVY